MELTKGHSQRDPHITVSESYERLLAVANTHLQVDVTQLEEVVERECINCMSVPCEVLFPCSHSQLCRGCLRVFVQRPGPMCPTCDAPLHQGGWIISDNIAHQDTFV